MTEYLLRFNIQTPDGSQEFYQTHFGSEASARDLAKKLADIYKCDIYVFAFAGKAAIEELPVTVNYITKLEEPF
jgi:hypothetical protein